MKLIKSEPRIVIHNGKLNNGIRYDFSNYGVPSYVVKVGSVVVESTYNGRDSTKNLYRKQLRLIRDYENEKPRTTFT